MSGSWVRGLASSVALAATLVAGRDVASESVRAGEAEAQLPIAWAPAELPRLDDGAAQLRLAEARLAEAASARGRARLLGRLHAVEALRGVRRLHPADDRSGARAAALAAVELRSLDLLDEAAAELEWALGRGVDDDDWPRWRLDAADLDRRRGEHGRAVAGYTLCGADPRLDLGQREQAHLWLARSLHALGRPREAEPLLVALAHDAGDPVRSIDAFDQLALMAVDDGDHGAAAGWIDSCRRRHARVAAEHTPTGDRARRALMRMRALVELRCAAFDLR